MKYDIKNNEPEKFDEYITDIDKTMDALISGR